MGNRFGSSPYAFEELVAEITAATACAQFHIYDDRSQENNIAYLQAWIQRIREEPAALIKDACDQAAKAFETFLQAHDTPAIYRQKQLEPMVRILACVGGIKASEKEMLLSDANRRVPYISRQTGGEIELEIRYRMGGENMVYRGHWHGKEEGKTLLEGWKPGMPEETWNHLDSHINLSDTLSHYQAYFRYNRDQVAPGKANAYLEALGRYLERCRVQINMGNACPTNIPLLEDFGIKVKGQEGIKNEERNYAHKEKKKTTR